MFSLLFYASILVSNLVSGYVIILSEESDIIQGGTTQFKAEVYKDDGTLSTSDFNFVWSDNAIPQHKTEFIAKSPALWNVTYNSQFPPSPYKVTVKVLKSSILIWTTVGSVTKTFDVTSFIKGDLVLSQGNLTRKKYVSNAASVNHHILLQKPYWSFINKTKNFIRTFWFVDCVYYGVENSFDFNFNYTKAETVHHVEALLVATYIQNLNETRSLLNVSEINVSKNNSSETNTTASVSPPNKNITNSTDNQGGIDKVLQEWLAHFNETHNFNASKTPDYCINSSVIPIVSNYTYGFFRTNLTVKAPVKVSPINGTNWLMDGEVLNINVSCNGSSPYSFCVLLESGLYNITGNETCGEETMLRNCTFGIQHLFKKPSEYTLVVIISNAVSKVVKPIAVNIYKVKKHAQLSVIIVPVSFSLIATILIIFGVAYYVQSKRKYTIEVADFDFGNQTSNMEYKSFRDRLRESISNSFLKSHDFEDNDSSWSGGASTSRKYGSMQ